MVEDVMAQRGFRETASSLCLYVSSCNSVLVFLLFPVLRNQYHGPDGLQ
jgi:hypothetical protein